MCAAIKELVQTFAGLDNSMSQVALAILKNERYSNRSTMHSSIAWPVVWYQSV